MGIILYTVQLTKLKVMSISSFSKYKNLNEFYLNKTMEPYTSDSLFDGFLICKQHKDGYRFSIDSILLANFVKSKKGA